MLCGELILKCVLAKPCNPLCDQESMRFEGWGKLCGLGNPPRSYCTWKTKDIPHGFSMWLNNDVFSAHRSAFPFMN